MKRGRWAFFRLAYATIARSARRTRTLGRLCLLGLLLHVVLLPTPCPATANDVLLRLDRADFVLSSSPQPPSDAAAWQQQPLPDEWPVSHPGTWSYGWYRVRLVLPAEPDQPYALYVPLLQTSAAVYVNGVQAGQTGGFEIMPRTARLASAVQSYRVAGLFPHAPHLLSIRPELLHAGFNTLHIRLWVKPGASGALSRLTIGPESSMQPLYERRVFVSVTGPQMVVVFSVGFGLFILLLWLRRRHESMYGYFAMTALAFALFVAGRFVVTDPPIRLPYWGVLAWVGLEGYIVLMCLFALRYAGWRWPRVEACLWAYLAISPFIDYASFVGIGGWVTAHWWLMTFVLTVFYVGIFWAIAWQRRTLETLGLAVAGSVKLIVSANERLLAHPVDVPRYQAFAYVPMFLMIGWILIDRFVKSLNESERLNGELERRVAQKHAALEQSYRRMQQMERQQAVVEERRRIMSDMHDGIGGQLISTLGLVEHGDASQTEVAAALRECLDDLRLTIDSLEPTENDLLPALGNLRYRLDPRLRKQGIDLDWRVQEVPKLSCLTPQNVLHVLRIVQEALTNALKHANANRVQVETGLDAAGENVYIRVRDNGSGFSSEGTGRGLVSMKRRAEIIGARLDIRPSAAGTTLNLLLPVA